MDIRRLTLWCEAIFILATSLSSIGSDYPLVH